MQQLKIVIHASGNKDGPEASWPAIKKYHVENNKWSDIGYHAGIEKLGDSYCILIGRFWDKNGAHTIGMNSVSLGFCFVGDFTTASPPDEMLKQGAEFIKFWMRLFNISALQVFPHRYFNQTDCPGAAFPWDKFIKLIGG